MATDADILAASKTRLLAIINGGVAEFEEGGESARLLEIDKLEKLIAAYESRVAAATLPVFYPVAPIRE